MAFESSKFAIRKSGRSRSLNTTAMLGGVVVGAFASRLLPPLAAMITGSFQARGGGDPFDRLKQDHRSLLARLEEMEKIPDSSMARRAASFMALKRLLNKHATAEEDVVYPMLHEQAGKDEAMRLYSEHAEMKVHLYELEMALRNKTPWGEHLHAIHDLIRRHIREEEDVQFPRLRNMLDERKSRTLSSQIRREEALVL